MCGGHKREENGGEKFSVLKVLLSQFLCFCVCVIRERKTPGEWRTWKCLKSFETLGLLWEKCLARNNFQNEFSLFNNTNCISTTKHNKVYIKEASNPHELIISFQVWYCTSSRSHTTISKYAEILATSFKGKKPFRKTSFKGKKPF